MDKNHPTEYFAPTKVCCEVTKFDSVKSMWFLLFALQLFTCYFKNQKQAILALLRQMAHWEKLSKN